MKKPVNEIAKIPFTGRSESHEQGLIELGVVPNSPMPTEEELDCAYLNLQKSFFPAVDACWDEFMRLIHNGTISKEDLIHSLDTINDPDIYNDFKSQLRL
jgi:hypothetical protein